MPSRTGTSQFYFGNGSALGQAPAAVLSSGAYPGASGQGITLNFSNADVHDVAKAILGDLLKLNYQIAPSIQGTITLATASPVSRDDVLPIFEQSLLLAGFALVQQDNLYRIVAAADAPRQAGTAFVAQPGMPMRPGFGLEIVPLRFVSATQMQNLLQPLVPNGSIISIDSNRNILTIAGTADQRATILEDVNLFDVDQMAGKSFALFRPQSINAKDLAQGLAAIIAGPDGQGLGGVVRLITLTRLNAVLAISAQPQYLTELQSWVQRLDQPSDTNAQQLYVYPVQNGKASDLAGVLTQAFNSSSSQATDTSSSASSDISTALNTNPANQQQSPGLPAPTSDANALSANGLPENPQNQAGTSTIMSVSGSSSPPLPSSSQSTAPASGDLSNTPSSTVSGSNDSSDNSSTPDIKVIADNVNNALVIRCLPSQYSGVQQALRELDVPPLEVMIEASVAEVTLTNQLQYGVQYYIQGGSIQAIQTTATTQSVAPVVPGFAAIFQEGQSIPIILSALQALTTVTVLSAPQLMVLNNQTANLQVGDQVPIATQQSQSTEAANAPIINSIAYQNTGVILKVTPRVNAGGLVTMDISQEVSEVSTTTTSTLNSPTISVRQISSTVAVHDGQTVALGGLISEGHTDSKSGVPILQNIPYLGTLFSTTNHKLTRTELLVLLTPHVVGDQNQAQAITDELRLKLSGTQPVLAAGQ